MRGDRKRAASPVVIGAVIGRKTLLVAVVPAGSPQRRAAARWVWNGAVDRHPAMIAYRWSGEERPRAAGFPIDPSGRQRVLGFPPDPFGPADFDWLRRLARSVRHHQRSS